MPTNQRCEKSSMEVEGGREGVEEEERGEKRKGNLGEELNKRQMMCYLFFFWKREALCVPKSSVLFL